CARCLPQPPHTPHGIEESGCEMRIAEEMVIQEVQVPARQTLDLRNSRINGLRVERAATFKKRLLVAKIANIGASARNHYRVGNEIQVPLDEITPDGRYIRKASVV